jgi:acyl-CoA reductase-like NAD-dependent aldehyde dehydrogenase
MPAHNDRASITKTWKLFIGGAYPRSESGRVVPLAGDGGEAVAYVAAATRKDLRDAVEAARGAQGKWASSTGYLRGQILYRLAEMMEGRRAELAGALRHGVGTPSARAAAREVDESIDRVVSVAGWSDKLECVVGGRNPVAGPFEVVSRVEPTGVAVCIAPPEPALLGFVSMVMPALASGNAAIAIASERNPMPALVLAEAAPGSDMPAGVLNILTGSARELAPAIAAHRDIDAVVACMDEAGPKARAGKGAAKAAVKGAELTVAAILRSGTAENMKRVHIIDSRTRWSDHHWTSSRAFEGVTEIKTVWHTVGD